MSSESNLNTKKEGNVDDPNDRMNQETSGWALKTFARLSSINSSMPDLKAVNYNAFTMAGFIRHSFQTTH